MCIFSAESQSNGSEMDRWTSEDMTGERPHKRLKLSNGTESTLIQTGCSLSDRDTSPREKGHRLDGTAVSAINCFNKIADLTDQIFESQATIGDHLEAAGEDVIRLALELNLKLKSWKQSKSLDQQRNERLPETIEQCSVRQYDPKLLETLHETTRGTQYRPPLPPIADGPLSRAPFTHQGSLSAEESTVQGLSYERLELLGDAYIELISTRIIYSRFPHLSAGRLSQLRESLVKNETLREFADRYNFGKEIHLSGELQKTKGGHKWTKILADVFEAYVAAVILSDPVDGFAKTEIWLTELWAPKLLHPEIAPKVPTRAAEELAKKIMGGGPSYKLDYKDMHRDKTRDGPVYFQIGVYFTGWGWRDQFLGSGTGISKKDAKQRAAQSALENRPLIDQIAAAKHEGLLARENQSKSK